MENLVLLFATTTKPVDMDISILISRWLPIILLLIIFIVPILKKLNIIKDEQKETVESLNLKINQLSDLNKPAEESGVPNTVCMCTREYNRLRLEKPHTQIIIDRLLAIEENEKNLKEYLEKIVEPTLKDVGNTAIILGKLSAESKSNKESTDE